MVKTVIKNCIICKKYLSKHADQITVPLPKDRFNEVPSFSVCSLDFEGPKQKSYIVLFTCGVSRAQHLKLVPNMTTNSFRLVFSRFTAKRGNCKVICSDNAKTFKKTKRELEILSDIMTDRAFINFVTKERIIWKNIIESEHGGKASMNT